MLDHEVEAMIYNCRWWRTADVGWRKPNSVEAGGRLPTDKEASTDSPEG
jgi:hypothetical protein